MTQSFLHVADVHLDSPLAKIKKLDNAIADQLQVACRQSFENVVSIALEREVSAVLIAGDLFDGPVKDASAALWVEGQFKRLVRAGIPVALILGNHDAVSASKKVTSWPKGVFEFSSERAATHVLDSAGLAIHGQSFGARVQAQDLAAKYPQPKSGYFNIGLLHTSLSSPGSHDAYAPTSVQVLENTGFDYWALGHIHLRSPASLSTHCFVGYAGNTQGRNIRETGPKGCNLVTLSDTRLESVDFLPTDCFRWQALHIDLSHVEHLRDIEDTLEEHLPELETMADGRPMAVRIYLEGTTSLHSQLSRISTMENLSEILAQRLWSSGEFWLESIRVGSAPIPQVNRDEGLAPLDFLSRVAESCRKEPVMQHQLRASLEELLKKTRKDLHEVGWSQEILNFGEEREVSDELNQLISQAENMLVSRLMGEDVA